MRFVIRSEKMHERWIALLFSSRSPNAWSIFFSIFSLTIKDKTNISLKIKILQLRHGQGSFTRKVRTIFTLKISTSIFVKLFLILVLHLRQFFMVNIFVKRATGLLVYNVIFIVGPKTNLKNDPRCVCGHLFEDAIHFFSWMSTLSTR